MAAIPAAAASEVTLLPSLDLHSGANARSRPCDHRGLRSAYWPRSRSLLRHRFWRLWGGASAVALIDNESRIRQAVRSGKTTVRVHTVAIPVRCRVSPTMAFEDRNGKQSSE